MIGIHMEFEYKILIGGRALVALGSNRNTQDQDYLVDYKQSCEPFLHEPGIDYCNANGHPFFRAIYKREKGNQIASPQSLLELKVFAWVQHYQNANYNKANEAEYDIKFLVINFGVHELKTVRKHISDFELAEAEKIIASVRPE